MKTGAAGLFTCLPASPAPILLIMKQLLCLLAVVCTWLPAAFSMTYAAGPAAVPLLAIRMVHPDNARLAAEGKPAPDGYTLYEYRRRPDHVERLFLKNAPVVTEADVKRAAMEMSSPEKMINVTLTIRGGKAMKEATSALRLGYDRLAVVAQGKVLSAPVMQAVISQSMAITGLDGEGSMEHLCRLLNEQAAARKEHAFSPRRLELYAVHPDSARLVKQGVAAVPGCKLWSRKAPGGQEGQEPEYLFLGSDPIVTGADAQSARPCLDHPGSLEIVWNGEGHRALERACAALRPGKDRIAVVVNGTVTNVSVIGNRPSYTTLIPGLGGDEQLDAICTAINAPPPPLTEAEQEQLKKDLRLDPVHPRGRELEQRFLPELEKGRTIRLKSGFHSEACTLPGFPAPVRAYLFLRPESVIGPEDINSVDRGAAGLMTYRFHPRAWEKIRAHMEQEPPGDVNLAVVFRDRVDRLLTPRFSPFRLWGFRIPALIRPLSVIYIFPPEEEQRMRREMFHMTIRGILQPICPWFLKNSGLFRTQQERSRLFLMDSAAELP